VTSDNRVLDRTGHSSHDTVIRRLASDIELIIVRQIIRRACRSVTISSYPSVVGSTVTAETGSGWSVAMTKTATAGSNGV
jgi:hypothetical protein